MQSINIDFHFDSVYKGVFARHVISSWTFVSYVALFEGLTRHFLQILLTINMVDTYLKWMPTYPLNSNRCYQHLTEEDAHKMRKKYRLTNKSPNLPRFIRRCKCVTFTSDEQMRSVFHQINHTKVACKCKFFWFQKSEIKDSVSFFTTEHVFRNGSIHASKNESQIFIRASTFYLE